MIGTEVPTVTYFESVKTFVTRYCKVSFASAGESNVSIGLYSGINGSN